MKLKKILVSMVVALGFVGLFGFTTKEVDAAQGYIMASGNIDNNIVGVWVEVQGGTSGWASRTPTITGQNYAVSWNYNTQNKPFQLHVGVGGNPQKWTKSIHTGWIYNYINGHQFNIIGNNIVY